MIGSGESASKNSSKPTLKIKKYLKSNFTNIKAPIKRKKVVRDLAELPSPRMTSNSGFEASHSSQNTDSHVVIGIPSADISLTSSINQTKKSSSWSSPECNFACDSFSRTSRAEGGSAHSSEPSRQHLAGSIKEGKGGRAGCAGSFVRVMDFGATAEQGARHTMEDQYVMLGEEIPFFAVYDGHGGTQCAEYLRDHLHQLILSHPEILSRPEKAISDSIVKTDSDFLKRQEKEGNESGSVCAVVVIVGDTLVIGNVGDCEAVLCRGGVPVVLTVKHTLQSNAKELERVHDAGGKVFHNRVGHPRFNPSVISLAVTRAIGDAGFKLDSYTNGKPSGIISKPDTTTIKLTSEDEFLVVGSDGLWDVMSYGEVIDFCMRRLKSGETAQTITDELTQAALNKGATDNVTTMLVHLAHCEEHPHSDELISETKVPRSGLGLPDNA